MTNNEQACLSVHGGRLGDRTVLTRREKTISRRIADNFCHWQGQISVQLFSCTLALDFWKSIQNGPITSF